MKILTIFILKRIFTVNRATHCLIHFISSMQFHHRKRFSKTVFSFPEDYLQERVQIRFNIPDSRATEAVILKYYPKCCHSLCFNPIPQSQSVLSRIKQIKILENIKLKGGYNDKKIGTKKMQQLIKNKRKTLRSLPVVNCKYSNHFPLEMCLFLPGIQNLKILKLSIYHYKRERCLASRSLERKMLKFYGYFWQTLKNVQNLEISTSSENLWVILPRLQSSKKFLIKLKSFRLVVDPQYPLTKNKYPRVLLQILLKNQDLLKYVTHLKFLNFYKFHYCGMMVKAILNCCTNLLSLSFPIEREFNQSDMKHLTLAPLQSPQNVQILTLGVDDIWGFIEAFEFPLLLSKFTLYLENKYNWLEVWHALYPRKEDEKYQILLSFFEKFKQLKALTCLDLDMPLFVPANQVMNNFILPMLRAIPKLENFDCRFSHVSLRIINFFEMSVFLNGIAPLKHLKSFKISQQLDGKENSIQSGDLVILFNPAQFYFLLNITSVHIDTWISGDFNFKQFLKMLSANLKEITFAKIKIDSVNSFHKILKIFNNAGHLHSARINLKIILCLEDLKQLSSSLVPAKNVFVTTDIYISSPKDQIIDPKDIEIIQNTFSNLKMNLTLVVPQNSRFKDSNKHIQILKNNFPFFKEEVKAIPRHIEYDFY